MVLDVILIAIVIVCVYLGYKRGFVRSLCNIFSWVVSIIVAYIAYGRIAEFITASPVGQFIQGELAKNMNLSKTDLSAIPEILRAPIEAGMAEAANSVAETLSSVIICIISVILTVILVKLLMTLILKLLKVFAKLPVLKQFNKFFGIIIGAINGCFWVCIIVLALTYISLIPNADFLHEYMNASAVVAMVAENSFLMGFFPTPNNA